MLTIYKASAGSGKTFQLTLEYLKLLFGSEQAYRHMLAVTFTNKATEEMKQRIVGELNRLARGEATPMRDALRASLGRSNDQIEREADSLLRRLLHDYSAFNISTIDRFFQQTTRAFTREIGLQGGYNLVLDNNLILAEAIDTLLSELELPENRELLAWLLEYAQEKVENGENWNFRGNIERLGGQLFNERYKQYREALQAFTEDKSRLSDYVRKLKRIQSDFEKRLQEIAGAALQRISDAGLTPYDFKGQSRAPFGVFVKWSEGTVEVPKESFQNLAGDLSCWIPPKADEETRSRIASVYPELNELVEKALALFAEYPVYVSAQQAARHLYTLGILNDIDSRAVRFQQEHNQLLLSDTAELLHRIIGESDTPFVYEKIGTRIDHYMIDEFQDTSHLQWENFYPLFRESLDKQSDCLIVGDVKQSIYRWRSSDWKLLSEELPRTFPEKERREEPLTVNWRSGEQIVRFNNTLFSRSAELLQEAFDEQCDRSALPEPVRRRFAGQIETAYADIVQQVAPPLRDRTGHVRLAFLGEEKGSQEAWTEEALRQLPEVVVRLQENGYALRDIAFLVRQKKEGTRIADFLLQYKAEHPEIPYRFDLISDESLVIGNAPAVKFVVHLMQCLVAPEEKIPRMLLHYEHGISQESLTPEEALSRYFEPDRNDRDDLFSVPEIEKQLPPLKRLPLPEICERMLALFPLKNNNDTIFIQAFQDLIADYTAHHAPDLPAFLAWWEERGKNKTISTPEEQDAMRILTIHKSKGLAFRAVIVPFCNWELDNFSKAGRENILWVHPEQTPFDEVPLLPLSYGSKLENSLFAESYFDEKLHSYIDNLNLAYVAFTRAKDELILFAPRQGCNRLNSLSALLYRCVSDLSAPVSLMGGEALLSFANGFDPENDVYETGSWQQAGPEPPGCFAELRATDYPSVSPDGRLTLRLKSEGFFENPQRSYGTLMHDVLSRIRTAADIETALQESVRAGAVSEPEAEMLSVRLHGWIESPEVAGWFSDDADVLTEAEILLPNGERLRPDRILREGDSVTVVDYKFGARKRESHRKQVIGYVRQLEAMGYSAVRGVLWYVERGETETVA